jgi:hypothetical protein
MNGAFYPGSPGMQSAKGLTNEAIEMVANAERASSHAKNRESKEGTPQAVKNTSTIQTKESKEMNTENTEVTPHQCPKCPKSFLSKAGLTMHTMRVHSGNTGYKWKARQSHNWDTSILEKERLERRRKYQRKLRARYKLQGRDSRGYPVTGKGGNKGMKLPSWSKERLAKFQSTMRRKAASKHGFKPKRIQIVYPDPREAGAETVTQPEIRFCPYCGFNIERHNK